MNRKKIDSLRAAIAAGDETALARALSVPLLRPGTVLDLVQRQRLSALDVLALARAARHSACPERSFDRLLDLAPQIEAAPQRWNSHGRAALGAVMGGSEAAARYILARPAMALPVCRGEHVFRRKTREVMRDELRWCRAKSLDDAGFESRLRRYRVREWVRIIARMAAGLANTALVLAELSDLADAVVDIATRYLLRRERSAGGPWWPSERRFGVGFAVLAQGKLGAQELNVSSDIDVQYFFSADDPGGTGPPELRERYHRVAQKLTAALSRRDADGFCYRVDLDLRPEGKKGALINSVAGAEHYYEAWGQSWERLALLRGRHVAGSAWVNKAFLQAVRPFVFPRSLDMATVEEIGALKQRLHDERRLASLRRGQADTIDVKRDAGGIREIELFVQILQVLHGGHTHALRTTSLLLVLNRLPFFGLLPIARAESLRHAYLFLRDVENGVQALEERQTHRLPDNPEQRLQLARLLKLRDGERVTRRVAQTQKLVRHITAPLFRTEGRVPRSKRTMRAMRVLAAPPEGRVAALADLGFNEPQEARGAFEALRQHAGGPFSRHAKEQVRRLAGPLLAEMAASPDPLQAMRLWVDLDRKLSRYSGYYRMLFDTPTLRRRLVDLLGTSEFLGRTITHFPELIDWLASARDPHALSGTDSTAMLHEARARLAKLTDIELKMRSLRRFKLQEQLRIGLLDLARTLTVEGVQEQLSMVAEVCLHASLDLVVSELHRRFEQFSDTRGFAILAMGRLGAREMGYGSDLDLLFVYDASVSGAPDGKMSIRMAQQLIQMLTLRFEEGLLYPIDTRLRPSGAQGPLVSEASALVQYHQTRGMLWERQALLKARPVAGDMDVGERVLAQLAGMRYPQNVSDTAAADMRTEIRRVRARMERELAREASGHANVKTGRGGLADIEFIVQFLQLHHAGRHPGLQVTSTLAAIGALQNAHLLGARETRILAHAYRFLRDLENRLRVVHDRNIAAVSFDGPVGVTLARRMGYPKRLQAAAALKRDYMRVTSRVRRLYERVFDVDKTGSPL